eukprot:6428554-Prymnesium_polylepis.3
MLIGADYSRSEPSLEGCEHELPSSDRTARELHSDALSETWSFVQNVTRGGRACESWLLVHGAFMPESSGPDALTMGRAA